MPLLPSREPLLSPEASGSILRATLLLLGTAILCLYLTFVLSTRLNAILGPTITMAVIVVGLAWVLHRTHPRASWMILIWGFGLGVTGTTGSPMGNGTFSIAHFSIPLFIMVAVWMLGSRQTIGLTLAVIVVMQLVARREALGLTHAPDLWLPHTRAITMSCFFLIALVIALVIQKEFRKNLEERARVSKRLELLNLELENAVDRRTGELRRANQALEEAQENLASLNITLEHRAVEAEAATRTKSAFLANVSHEIRTPMNAILGMTHLALQTELTEQQRQYLQKTRIAADGLLGIINDILDFSKIEAGKLQMDSKEFLLEEVYERVTQLVGTKASEKHLEFMLDTAPDVPASLIGDPLRLGQVLTNLCSNAVKFTQSGEIIVVTFRRLRGEDDRVTLQFCVRDTGIGMTPEQIQELFQPFSQVDASSTRRFGGTGLGLAISKHLVEMMGGEIWVVSEPGQGSEFYFTATFGLGHLQAEPRAQATGLNDLCVLVVDDSASARDILQNLVSGLGYRVATAASAEEGFAELKRAPYDLVLLDWNMPEIDGFEAARWIRQDASLPSAPKIILVTAYGDEELARRTADEKLDGYLAKPVTPSTLFDAVMRAFGGQPTHPPVQGLGANGQAPEEQANLRGAKVLLVEDNDFNQQVATELLGMMGVDVTLAANGLEALEQVRNHPYNAVLMDLQMPLMDGYEATRRLRMDPAFNSLPILAMTAHAMVQERERCMALGMNDYITKPINPKTLAAVLAKWVRPDGSHPPARNEPAAIPDQAWPSELPGIAWEEGLARFGGKKALLEGMLSRFLELESRAAEAIRNALAQGDPETASRLAHSMTSAAGTIGAMGLSDLAKRLDHAIRLEDREVVEPLLAGFEKELALVMEGLSLHFGPKES
jgi:signal transduction histidine kinase/DNA-binding response OmpR family regulator